MPDVLIHYRVHNDNTHKKNKKLHLAYISQIFSILFESIKVENSVDDIAVCLLISDSNPNVLGIEDLMKIETWLIKFKQYGLENNLFLSQNLEIVISRIWKECYWKIDKNALYYYTKYLIKYKAWRLFSPADLKHFIKKTILNS